MDKQAVTRCSKRTRLHPFQQSGVISTQQIQADVLPFASTPALGKRILHLAHTVWVQADAKIQFSELATGQHLLVTCPNV